MDEIPLSTVRYRVLVPGDNDPGQDFYKKRDGPEAREPLNKTAFREAERQYKKNNPDLSNVFDFKYIDRNTIENSRQIKKVGDWDNTTGIYEIEGVEGFKFVPSALDTNEQLHYVRQSFASYMKRPNSTNLDALYEIPDKGLFPFYRDDIRLEIKKKAIGTKPASSQIYDKKGLESLIHKIRWVTLGHQYNWTTKEYNFDEEAVPFPQDLANFSKKTAEKLGFGTEYKAEAGIVNFYKPDDTLTGHVDRSEKNMTAPLISISFGLSAIFLLGGVSRESEPVRAIIVRSGDLSILSGPCRLFFHGIPKILPDSFDFKSKYFPSHQDSTNEDLTVSLELMRDCRININIRQVI